MLPSPTRFVTTTSSVTFTPSLLNILATLHQVRCQQVSLSSPFPRPRVPSLQPLISKAYASVKSYKETCWCRPHYQGKQPLKKSGDLHSLSTHYCSHENVENEGHSTQTLRQETGFQNTHWIRSPRRACSTHEGFET
jgi:hypothetical protein